MRLRLKYAGADDAAITVYDTADDLAAAVQKAGKPVVVLPNYTSISQPMVSAAVSAAAALQTL